jgi:hypothetical protein
VTGEEIRDLLTKLASIYPALDQSPEAKRRVLAAWEWVLGDADGAAVMAAARRWAREHPDRPPRPGDLLASAGETRNLIDDALYGRYARLRRMVQQSDGALPDGLCRELVDIERQIGLRPGATAASWQGAGGVVDVPSGREPS